MREVFNFSTKLKECFTNRPEQVVNFEKETEHSLDSFLEENEGVSSDTLTHPSGLLYYLLKASSEILKNTDDHTRVKIAVPTRYVKQRSLYSINESQESNTNLTLEENTMAICPKKCEARNYKLSQRIINLAKCPNRMRSNKYNKSSSSCLVKKSALCYIASPRLAELATPIKRTDTTTKKSPFKVQESALNYQITKRTLNISTPKHFRRKYIAPR